MLLQAIQNLHQSDKSAVTLMLDTETGRKVVVKELAGTHLVYEKLQKLRHPYLPRVLSVVQADGKTCVTEEYIEGVSLGQASLSERALARAFLELCGALEFLHKHGILHRDIKPEHILLAPGGHIRLIDFDAAREPKDGEEQDTRLLGTRGYAPPEQYGFSQTDARADFYALGATFRQLLEPAARKGRWKRILRKCTALDPKDRYRSAGQIRRAVYWGRFLRWVIRPVCLLVVGLHLAMILLLLSAPTSRLALFSLFGLADTQVWEEDEIDLAALERAVEDGTAPLMYEYSGSAAMDAYHMLESQYPDLLFIYSGYMDPEGALVFGCIETNFMIRYGVYTFNELRGIIKVTPEGEVYLIGTKEQVNYAPAVITIYEIIQRMPRLE